MNSNVTAIVSTKDRYFTSLPNLLVSIAMQTVKPERLIIYDDGEQRDLRSESLYQNIFLMLQQKGIAWEVAFGKRLGQVSNHQSSIKDAKTDWIWRLDDDNFPEPECLENLLKSATDGVGAVGGLVLDPKLNQMNNSLASNKIEDIFLGLNIQWFKWEGIKEVDHLYSTFIFRKEAAKHGYCMELSRVGHREETMFTYEMKRAGWKLLVNSSALTWHMRDQQGGIRSGNSADMWKHDEDIFLRKLNEWDVHPKIVKLVVLDSGLGDHIVFKKTLPELKTKHKNIVLAVCYPQVFKEDTDVVLISIAEAKQITNIDQFNIYKWMDQRQWKQSLEQAYREAFI
jgi:GT2 family glycosyltransferase